MKQFKWVLSVAALLFCFSSQADSISEAASNTPVAEYTQKKFSTSGMNEVAGRVLTLLVHPLQPNKMWAGTAQGGLWHSTDTGNSWISASVVMRNLPVSSLTFDPNYPDIMYAGTGEGRSNAIAQRGKGIFKSEDGGASWNLLPLTSPETVGENWSHINYITISSEGTVLAATSDKRRNGFIYRSKNGGQTWGLFPVYTGSKVGPHNLVHKVRFDPKNPNTAVFMDDYANVTHSTDAGMTWNVVRKSSTSCK